MATLFDYLPEDAVVVMHGEVQEALLAFRDDAEQRFRFIGNDAERPALKPQEIFLGAEEFFVRAQAFARLSIAASDAAAAAAGTADADPTRTSAIADTRSVACRRSRSTGA